MRFTIGFICFWISILGFMFFIKNKTKLKSEFIIPVLFSCIGVAMFLSGLLNIMKISALAICLIGIFLFLYQLQQKTISIKKDLLDTHLIIYFVVVILIALIGYNMKLTHYDNFSHWGLIIKNIFLKDGLPNFENAVIMFKGYQPGTACFTYLIGLLCGRTEGVMIIAHNLLIFTYLSSLLAFVKDKAVLKKVLFILLYLFIMTINISFNDLLVDTLIATMSIATFSMIFYYQEDLKKCFLLSLPTSIFLILVKNTGLVLAGFNCLYLLFIAFKNKQLKEGIRYVLISSGFFLLILLIWQGHVAMVYGESGLDSKHSLSTGNILQSLRQKGINNIIEFIKIYIMHFFTLKNNIANIFIVVINGLVLLQIFINKNVKEILKMVLLINFIYILYFGILGLMYLLSMPWNEAIRLASYDRYMLTIITIIVGIVYIYLSQMIIPKPQQKFNTGFLLVVIITLISFLVYNWQDTKIFLGVTSYKNSVVERYDAVLKTANIDETYKYYIYSPSSKGDSGYLGYLSKYKLNHTNIMIINNISNLEKITDFNRSKILVLEPDDIINEFFEKSNWEVETVGVYRLKELEKLN